MPHPQINGSDRLRCARELPKSNNDSSWKRSVGNNEAFTTFEATVIATYDKGALDKALLSTLMEQYRGADIDHGGMVGTLSRDGLDVEEIVLKLFGKACPQYPSLPKDHRTWTPEQERQNDEYWELRSAAFAEISRGLFGWS